MSPFASPRQEIFLRLNHPEIWQKFYNEHGHAKGYKKYLRNMKRKPHGRKKTRKK